MPTRDNLERRSARRCSACTTRRARSATCRAARERAAATGGDRPLRRHGRARATSAHGERRDFVERILDAATRSRRRLAARREPRLGRGRARHAQAVMDAWMDSPDHRSTILRRAYRDIGVGIRLGVPQRRRASARRSPRTSARASKRCCAHAAGPRRAGAATCCAARRAAHRRPRRHARRRSSDVNLAAAVAHAQAQAGGADGLGAAWCGDALTADDTAHAAYPAEPRADQGRLRLRRRPPEPLRRLGRRAAGQRRDRAALPRRAGRRDEGDPLRHGHALRAGVRGHPDRRAARAARDATPATSARSPARSQAAIGGRPARATRSSSPTSCRPPATSSASAETVMGADGERPARRTRTTAAG